jgi:hypothetical protein
MSRDVHVISACRQGVGTVIAAFMKRVVDRQFLLMRKSGPNRVLTSTLRAPFRLKLETNNFTPYNIQSTTREFICLALHRADFEFLKRTLASYPQERIYTTANNTRLAAAPLQVFEFQSEIFKQSRGLQRNDGRLCSPGLSLTSNTSVFPLQGHQEGLR